MFSHFFLGEKNSFLPKPEKALSYKLRHWFWKQILLLLSKNFTWNCMELKMMAFKSKPIIINRAINDFWNIVSASLVHPKCSAQGSLLWLQGKWSFHLS